MWNRKNKVEFKAAESKMGLPRAGREKVGKTLMEKKICWTEIINSGDRVPLMYL